MQFVLQHEGQRDREQTDGRIDETQRDDHHASIDQDLSTLCGREARHAVGPGVGGKIGHRFSNALPRAR
jgi:hypothetical protein